MTDGAPVEVIQGLRSHIPPHEEMDGVDWRMRGNFQLALTAYITMQVSPDDLIALPTRHSNLPYGARPMLEQPFDQGLKSSLTLQFRREGYRLPRPLEVDVDHRGQAALVDGQVQAYAAAAAGLQSVPVRISYHGGSERLKTSWRPGTRSRWQRGPSPFDPSQIGAAMIAWFEADRQPFLVPGGVKDGDVLNTIYDSGPLKLKQSAPTYTWAAGFGPTWVANAHNGYPAFRFAARQFDGCTNASTTTSVVTVNGGTSLNYWVGATLYIVVGTGAGQSSTVTASNGGTYTVSPAFVTAPNSTSQIVVSFGNNSLCAVTLNGTIGGGALPAPYNPLFNGFTEVVVFNYISTGNTGNPVLVSHAGGGGGNIYRSGVLGRVGAVHGGSMDNSVTPIVVSGTTYVVFMEWGNVATPPSRLRVNGVEFDNGPTGPGPNPYINSLGMGNDLGGGGGANPANADIMAHVVYRGKLSLTEQTAIETFYNNKYRLAGIQ